jgi:hypothetical protein
MNTKTPFTRLLTLGALLAGFAINNASATVTFDLRATSLTGAGQISGGGKTVSGFASGDVITLTLFVDEAFTGGTLANASFQSVVGSVLGVTAAGSVNGNFTAGAATVSPFNGNGNGPGALADLNADGFIDIGTNTNNTTTNSVNPRAAAETTGTAAGATAITNGAEFTLETFQFTIGSVGTSAETINFRESTGTSTTTATWNENGTNFLSKGPGGPAGNGTLFGSAVSLSGVAIPEPGTWAMLMGGFGTLIGLQRFRRKMA